MTDDFVWTPPGATPGEVEEFLGLRAGLPPHASESVNAWITEKKYSHEYIKWDFMVEFQQVIREDLGFQAVRQARVDEVMKVLRKLSEKHRTWLVHFLLTRYRVFGGSAQPGRVSEIRKILDDSGSSWTVGVIGGRYGLIERMPGAVVDVVASVVSDADVASGLLQSAWELAYGVTPKPSHAYYDAVRAVEALSCPLVSPKDSAATLGKDISVLRNAPQAWEFSMSGSAHTSAIEHVTKMMQLLWHSQTDRHGRADYEDVTPEEAQAAVLLASTLIGWLAKGMLRRIEP